VTETNVSTATWMPAAGPWWLTFPRLPQCLALRPLRRGD
jgi:hypothetical protein